MHTKGMLKILLIDDDQLEKEIIKNILDKCLVDQPFLLQHVYKSSEAISALLQNQFDLVLLDNMLASSISGKFSVPIIQQYLKEASLVIVSNDVSADYLSHPHILGVDSIVDKKNLEGFLKNFISGFGEKKQSVMSDLISARHRSTHAA
jgi:CheY-like chemotaxis protein